MQIGDTVTVYREKKKLRPGYAEWLQTRRPKGGIVEYIGDRFATILMIQDGKPLYRESFFLSEVRG